MAGRDRGFGGILAQLEHQTDHSRLNLKLRDAQLSCERACDGLCAMRVGEG
ncbi:MAG: hypothetical protein R2748_09465 [Bryobacterales bacterium]